MLATQQNDPFLGKMVADRFEVIERIGAGGMGTVYEAVQRPLGRAVALKLLKEEVSWDPDTITRFHREAKAMSLLAHPNTVKVFDFGQTPEGTLFLAMERLHGELLTQRVESQGALEPEEAIIIAQQILGSLHEAHSKGIVHRDLKPDNIYLANVDGHAAPVVKVLDFGIAKVFEGENDFDQLETQAGTVFGTPRYMSPEQAQGKNLDARSDLYSVGVLLYQLVTGLAPFRDDDAVVVMAKHIREKPEAPTKAAPTRPISPALNRVILKALEKEANKRFQSAEVFIRALENAAEQQRNHRTSATGVFTRTSAQRSRLRLSLSAAGLLLVSIVLGVLIFAGLGAGEEVATAPETSVGPIDVDPGETWVGAPPARLSSEPEGAAMYRQGTTVLLGHTPFEDDSIEEEIEVELRLEGFEAQVATLRPDGILRQISLRESTPEPVEAPVAERRPRRPRSTMAAMEATPMAPAAMAPAPMASPMAPISGVAGSDGYGRLD